MTFETCPNWKIEFRMETEVPDGDGDVCSFHPAPSSSGFSPIEHASNQ
jgi:hypothetical protein